jgi:hypothetical protein
VQSPGALHKNRLIQAGCAAEASVVAARVYGFRARRLRGAPE